MQTTTPNQTVPQNLATARSGQRTLKSFAALNSAIVDKEIDQFALLIRQGIDMWRTAGKLLVETSLRQPDIFRMIQARHPHISESTLQTFARIGRNELWPPLLLDSSMGARKLLECNYDLQKEYSEKPFEVAVTWKHGEIQTIQKKVSELSREEVARVFDGNGGVNTLEKQAWRIRNPNGAATPAPADDSPTVPKAPRMANVDVGYFSIELQTDGTVQCKPCGKSAIAQPVRVLESATGLKTNIVLYKQVVQ